MIKYSNAFCPPATPFSKDLHALCVANIPKSPALFQYNSLRTAHVLDAIFYALLKQIVGMH